MRGYRRTSVDVAAEAVIAVARKMPRATPASGGTGTVHTFEVEAGLVWELDKVLKDYDAALEAERYYS